ncbi:MAG TPA: hypothetical protein VN841_03090 [Bryobacteraceae bacterium]|nr:hypothetical protein [Bryobacteraceae bacterium]
MSPTETPRAPYDKILSLLQEYTKTLREARERELDRRYRCTVLQVGTLVFLAGGGLYLFQLSKDRAVSVADLYILGGAALALTGLVWSAISRGIKRYSYDAEEVAGALSDLIEMAYQLSEHASKRITNRFEFDLRLGEAKAVLRTHHDAFGPPKGEGRAMASRRAERDFVSSLQMREPASGTPDSQQSPG